MRRLGWIALLLGLIWHALVLGSLFQGTLNPLFHDSSRDIGDDPRLDYGKGLDFFSIYQAGWNFRHGLSVYYGVRQSRFGPENTVVPYFSGFRYLPWYAYLYGSVLSLVPPWTSYWCWIGCVELMLAACMLITWRLARGDPLQPLATSLWLLFSPYYLELYMGQQSMVTVLLLLICGAALMRDRPELADGAYGGSVLWKLNTLVVLPLWIRLGRWRALSLVGGFMLASSVPYFWLVPGAWDEFVGYFHHALLPDGPNAFGLPALTAVAWRRFELPPALLGAALSWTGRALVVLGGLATFANRRIDPVRLLALWICSYFLIYKFVWEHHFVLMLPVTVLLLLRLRSLWILPAHLLVALPSLYGLLAVQGERFPQLQWSAAQELLYHSVKLAPILALFLLLSGSELLRAVRERDLWLPAMIRQFLRERA